MNVEQSTVFEMNRYSECVDVRGSIPRVMSLEEGCVFVKLFPSVVVRGEYAQSDVNSRRGYQNYWSRLLHSTMKRTVRESL